MNRSFFTKVYAVSMIGALLMANVAVIGAPQLVRADESRQDQVIVTQVVTAAPDIVAPSVPTNVVATALSTTQITVTWTASTDNVNVAGYRVFRDGLFLATTSATTYADTGLTPSTLYGYEVSAFDPSVNISATSTPIAEATTLTPTVVPPAPIPGASGGGAGTSGFGNLQLLYLLVNPGTSQATISFGSNRAVAVTTQWGETADLELGSSVQSAYQKDHTIIIPGLTADTQYYFNLRLVDEYGRVYTVSGQQFRTLPVVMPSIVNVSEFVATARDTYIALSWKNPASNFDVVRIVRSDKFFPRDPSEGQVIYEGRAQVFDDRSVVAGITYYYSLFTVRDGRYSSGATAFARISKAGMQTISDLFADLVELPSRLIHPLIAQFSLDRIIFAQNGVVLPMVVDTVTIDAGRTLHISVPYGALPEVLKTIVVTLFDANDNTKSFSFLLRVNEEKTAYEALVAPLQNAGVYRFRFLILDHKHQGLKKLHGFLDAFVPEPVRQAVPFYREFAYTIIAGFVLLGVLGAVIWILLMIRRHERDVMNGPTPPQI